VPTTPSPAPSHKPQVSRPRKPPTAESEVPHEPTLGSEWRSGDEEHLLLADPAREGTIDLLEHVAHTYEA
jgi:hypothetical protein